jgi:hypothetical protein
MTTGSLTKDSESRLEKYKNQKMQYDLYVNYEERQEQNKKDYEEQARSYEEQIRVYRKKIKTYRDNFSKNKKIKEWANNLDKKYPFEKDEKTFPLSYREYDNIINFCASETFKNYVLGSNSVEHNIQSYEKYYKQKFPKQNIITEYEDHYNCKAVLNNDKVEASLFYNVRFHEKVRNGVKNYFADVRYIETSGIKLDGFLSLKPSYYLKYTVDSALNEEEPTEPRKPVFTPIPKPEPVEEPVEPELEHEKIVHPIIGFPLCVVGVPIYVFIGIPYKIFIKRDVVTEGKIESIYFNKICKGLEYMK